MAELKENETIKCKPFLRWAGGKTWFKKHIADFLPVNGYNQYHEPFLGGAAIFFHLQHSPAFLSDLNLDLIETYIEIRDNVEEVISHLKQFKNTKEFYYKVRSSKYRSKSKQAAKFIYLNQTSFNGIYRVNLKGEYNVPYGYRTKDFFEPENLRQVSIALKDASINHCGFTQTINNIQENDLVFLDPPYTVAHNDNGFIKYNAKLFDLEKQHELSRYIDEVKERGAYYILTNAAHTVVDEIFTKESDSKIGLSRASLIGGKKAKRGTYKEFIFTNTIVND